MKAAKPGNIPKALDLLQDMTVNKLRTLHVETNGSNRPSDSVSTTPKRRKIKCKMCDEIFSSVRDLNLYPKQDHGVVKCPSVTSTLAHNLLWISTVIAMGN